MTNLIARVWFQIVLVMLLTSMPLFVLHRMQLERTMAVLDQISDSRFPEELAVHYLDDLNRLKNFDPERSAIYTRRLELGESFLIEAQSKNVLRSRLEAELAAEALWNASLVLVVSLTASLLISMAIVRKFRRILTESLDKNAKLKDLRSLSSWQRIAKELVHELRGPLTPIKMLSSSLTPKFESMPRESYARYLEEASRLIESQTNAMEGMIESFTEFARLPDPQLAPWRVKEFLERFERSFKSFDSRLVLTVVIQVSEDTQAEFDPELIQRLLFNLLRNALEANPDGNVPVVVLARLDWQASLAIEVSNRGKMIADAIRERIFEPHFTTYGARGRGGNLGLGLPVCRKIALDHGGDLKLIKNADQTVAFQLQLPLLTQRA
ncbi:MAG TPA: HAMP domain-containing sensor histidine kinase [Oligoflexus sp.]|uniref:HAMP domain-containing sensor histidine kinase n=1 Tax=Oligoflexus sp. TaxID=1971216 RepID=UPI002D2A7524|nr:HAMP domain-containing sensor histidine kinase [Oligoflexus sp.]HYX31826.1 HAMP domain-containing sensor histidine kinase [Oligoflexus sp.]